MSGPDAGGSRSASDASDTSESAGALGSGFARFAAARRRRGCADELLRLGFGFGFGAVSARPAGAGSTSGSGGSGSGTGSGSGAGGSGSAGSGTGSGGVGSGCGGSGSGAGGGSGGAGAGSGSAGGGIGSGSAGGAGVSVPGPGGSTTASAGGAARRSEIFGSRRLDRRPRGVGAGDAPDRRLASYGLQPACSRRQISHSSPAPRSHTAPITSRIAHTLDTSARTRTIAAETIRAEYARKRTTQAPSTILGDAA